MAILFKKEFDSELGALAVFISPSQEEIQELYDFVEELADEVTEVTQDEENNWGITLVMGDGYDEGQDTEEIDAIIEAVRENFDLQDLIIEDE